MSTPLTHPRNRVPRFAESAAERARLTVVPRRSRKAPRVPFVTLVSVLLVGGVAGLLLFNTNMQQASFTATALESRAAALDAREQSLQMKLDRMRDPQRLAVRAQRLGMVPSDSPAFIRLSDGKVLGNPEVAEPGATVRITPLPTRKPSSLRPPPYIATPAPAAEDTAHHGRGHARDDAGHGKARAQKATNRKHDTTSASADAAASHGKKRGHEQPTRQGSSR
ncbi:MAG TPA: hypothetical protein VF049_19195 [Nocardioidaceae bacterium]